MAKSYIVIGLGRFGSAVARGLAEFKLNVLAIDKDEKAVESVSDFVTQTYVGDATDEKLLKGLDIGDVDGAIIGVSEIQESILITLILKEIGIKNIIARASGELHKKVLEKIGATRIILPEKEVGEQLARSIASPHLFEQIEMSEKYSLAEVKPLRKWIGKTLKQAEIRKKYNISIIGIKRKYHHIDEKGEVREIEDLIIAPTADTEILKDDILIVIGDKQSIEKIR